MSIKVVSLFDGISCGRVALDRAGIEVDKYYASEVDPKAMLVGKSKYKDIIHIGDVIGVNGRDYKGTDLLIGGSPCQGFSFSGKVLNFNDPRSKLFFEFARVVKQMSPRYWLLENVVMSKSNQDIISKYLGVEPVKLNSSFTSAQNRVRLYWANFPISQPIDRGIELSSILETNDFIWPAAIRGRRLQPNAPITQCLEVRAKYRNKNNCLTTVAKDTVLTTLQPGRYPDPIGKGLPFRHLTKVERCRLMNLPDNFCDAMSNNQAVKATGNGWDAGMIEHIFNGIKF